MAGDLGFEEALLVSGAADKARAMQRAMPGAAGGGQGRVIHSYGDAVRVVLGGTGAGAGAPSSGLSSLEALGAKAFQLRSSAAYAQAKRSRPRAGQTWNLPPGGCAVPPPRAAIRALRAGAPAVPTSAYLEGSVAVGLVIVDGPTEALRFTEDERIKVVAEVQNGLGFYAGANPAAVLTFVYDIQTPVIDVEPDPAAGDLEGLWRNPAMAALGYPDTWEAIELYIEHLRSTLGTRWTYCAYFTKYPVFHFAYAYIGGGHLVMQYDNDGWGPDNIDRVFAHETGHIFNAPDEYAESGCTCGGEWGRWLKPNSNCQNCAPAGSVSCIMCMNDWTTCALTPAHLGWMPSRLYAKNSGKSLDVAQASQASGAGLIQWAYHGGENQQFRLDPMGDGYYRIVAQHSGQALGVSGGSLANGAAVVQQDGLGGQERLFRLEPLGDGCVRAVARHSGKVLDVYKGSPADGAQIIQWDWNGGDNQRWRVGSAITAKHSMRVLEIAAGSGAAGAELVQSSYHGGGSQIVLLDPLGDGYFRLVMQHSGKVLDVFKASHDDGAPLIQWDWNGGDNQRFRLEALADGYLRIVAKHSGKVLDVTRSSSDDGAKVIQWPWHGGDNQRWLAPQSWFAVGVHPAAGVAEEPAPAAPLARAG